MWVSSSTQRRTAAVLLGLAATSVVALHVLEPELDPSRRFMSEYTLGPWGGLMRAVFFLLAASGVLLARALVSIRNRVVVYGLLGWSLGMTLAGLFVTDSSLPGAIHTWTGVLHDGGADFACVALAIAALGSSSRGWVLASAMIVVIALGHALHLPGLGQRGFATLAIGWQLVLARGRPPRVP